MTKMYFSAIKWNKIKITTVDSNVAYYTSTKSTSENVVLNEYKQRYL